MDLRELVSEEKRDLNRSLARSFYVDDSIFEAEVSHVVSRQWLYADHENRIPRAGDYFLFEVAGESIIVSRQKDGSVAAFYNVCRHRGSRVCLEHEGNASHFLCPYHAWSYNIDGSLRAAAYMPPSFEKGEGALQACHVRVLEGLIFVCLVEGTPPDFDTVAEIARPFLALNGTAGAKLAARQSYPTSANWKLVVDNFQECYHCAPSHKLYSSIHSKNKLLAFGAGPGSGPQQAVEHFTLEFDDWRALAEASGTWLEPAEEAGEPRSIWSVGRLPVKTGALTESVDGTPVSSLMGEFTEFDGGQSAVAFNVFSYFLAANDHVVMIRFTPQGTLETDIEFQWFVHPDAVEGVDYDVERLVQVWDITTREDKKITEDNQAGVHSRRYQPGCFSELEGRLATIKNWYLHELEFGLAREPQEIAA